MASIFSTYKQGENRVTSTIVEVMRSLPINVVERFLAMFTGNDNQEFFHFQNQPKGSRSVPDAEISANFRILFETKIVGESINKDQLKKHLEHTKVTNAALVYITPDFDKPAALNDTVTWKNFETINHFITELIEDPTLILSERDQFLLRNLQEFFEAEKLLPIKDEVVVVAASTAWPMYQKHQVYVCQNNRTFRRVRYMGFYAEGAIQKEIAPISCSFNDVKFTRHDIDQHQEFSESLKKRLLDLLDNHAGYLDGTWQVFDLEACDGNVAEELKSEIGNNLKNEKKRGYAYTQGQRYTTLEKLRAAKTTTDLIN